MNSTIKQRITEGKCVQCGGDILDQQNARCVKCREYNRKKWQMKYYARKAARKCVKCGRKIDREGALCQDCNSKQSLQHRNDYKFYQNIGICPICHKEKILGDEKICLLCSAERYSYRNEHKHGGYAYAENL